MNSSPGGSIWIAVLLVVVTGGCAEVVVPVDPEVSSGLRATIAADEEVLTPGKPIWFHVTATNAGEDTESWGQGSSTCRLHLVVRAGNEDQLAADDRLCTTDVMTFTLRPGASRTEVIPWDGRVHRGSEVVRLAPGVYEVRGAAGQTAVSEPIPVEVRAGR